MEEASARVTAVNQAMDLNRFNVPGEDLTAEKLVRDASVIADFIINGVSEPE